MIRPRRWIVPGVVAVLLAAFFLQAVLSMRMKSATSDETYHLPAGYTYLKTGDLRLNREHPPLIKELAALPLLPLDIRLDLEDPNWLRDPPRQVPFGVRFLHHLNDADTLLFRGRLPVVLLGVFLGVYVFRWAADLHGPGAGCLALFLYALDPNVIAHARFVTMDLGVGCFQLVALYHLWRWVRGGGRGQLVAAGLATGATLGAKFSGVALIPAAALLLAGAALWPSPADGGHPPFAGATTGHRLSRAARAVCVLLLLAGVVVWAVYLFPSDPLFYVKGMQQVNANHDPDYYAYMLGQFKQGGWWYYPLVAFVLKTPVPMLIALGLSVGTLRRLGRREWLDAAFLWVPIALFTAGTCALADNLGIRYLLPVYPLLAVWLARLGAPAVRRHWSAILAVSLALWYGAGTLRIYPDYLSYFNELTGGPSRGHLYLDDSNIDWGQDLPRLGRWLERNGVEQVRLLYRWNADPNYYGIPWRPIGPKNWYEKPRPGWYAISTQWLIRGELSHRLHGYHTNWLSRYEPYDRVGYSFYIFRFE